VLSTMRSRAPRSLLVLLAIAGPLAGLAAGVTAADATVAAPPANAAGVRAAEMPVLQQIDVPAAWRASQGKGVTVAVLDTGVDASAPDLAGQVITGPDYVQGAEPPGYKLPLEQGTYVASLIAGHGRGPGDAMGVMGVAPRAKILSVRVIPDAGEPGLAAYHDQPRYADALSEGIDTAVRDGAKVITVSLSVPQPSSGLRRAIAFAIARGAVVVASAGDGGTASGFAPYRYPASFPGVIAVAAVNSAGARASFSQQNSSVVVAAPGVDVAGASPDGQYVERDSTSAAAALVSGVVALILARYPQMTPPAVEQAIATTASHQPAGGYSVDTGFGEVDAAAALAAAASYAAPDAGGPGSVDVSGPGGQPSFAIPIPGLSTTVSGRTRLARSLPPIIVTRRDEARIVVCGLTATAAAVLAAISLATMIVFSRRPRPRPAGLELANMPPGDDLIS